MIEENERLLQINEEKLEENVGLLEEIERNKEIIEVLKKKCYENEIKDQGNGEVNALRTQIKHWKQMHENSKAEINKLYGLISEKQRENEDLLLKLQKK